MVAEMRPEARHTGIPAATRTDEGFTLTGPGTRPRDLLAELWRSRRLVGVLARKDFFVRYRRTRLGLLWAIALPLVQAVVLAAVFSSLVTGIGASNGEDGDLSYAVFVFAGLVPWTFFNSAFPTGATSVVDGASLAQHIYFPRLVLPLVAVMTALYPLAATLLVLLGLVVALGPGLGLATLWLLPGVALVLLLAFGLALLFSAAQVYLRDLRFVVTAGMTMLFYLTPIIYPVTRVPARLQRLVEVLPAAGPVELFRNAVGAAGPGLWRSVVASLLWAVAAGAAGFVLHCRRDRVLSDLL
jgi:ABC-type polysaccharide/polyol phosphate export permease